MDLDDHSCSLEEALLLAPFQRARWVSLVQHLRHLDDPQEQADLDVDQQGCGSKESRCELRTSLIEAGEGLECYEGELSQLRHFDHRFWAIGVETSDHVDRLYVRGPRA